MRATSTLPTFVARREGEPVGFLSLREHFPEAEEIHCVAFTPRIAVERWAARCPK